MAVFCVYIDVDLPIIESQWQTITKSNIKIKLLISKFWNSWSQGHQYSVMWSVKWKVMMPT